MSELLDDRRPLRVLQVVGSMDRAGAETWLMHVLRRVDRGQIRFDFLVHSNRRYAYSDEIESLGCRVIACGEPRRPLSYSRNFARAVAAHGPYDAVHTHLHYFNGLVLRLAARSGIRARIAHCHTDDRARRATASTTRRVYYALTGRWIRRYATAGVACSRAAAENQFGEAWTADPRWSVHHCAIELEPFRAPVDLARIRAEWDIPAEAIVVGQVGRLASVKNHVLSLDVAAELARRRLNFRLLLVGEGSLRQEIQERIRTLGIEKHCILTGSRNDVARLLKAIDVALLPSHHEGLPLTLLETQAAGVPCVASDRVTTEADVVPELVRRVSLSAGVESWAESLLSMVRCRGSASERQRVGSRASWLSVTALAALEQSPFNIATSAAGLQQFYQRTCGAAQAA